MKVSIITPSTRNDRLPRLEAMVESQDYKDIEHIIIKGHGESIGKKRNKACEIATGDVIVHFDDDDFFAPDYISKSVKHLIGTKADVTGLSSAYFLHDDQSRAWLYKYNSKAPYVIGSGMMYYKRVWLHNKFKDVNNGEDTIFLGNAGRIVPHDYINGFVASIHDNNTASHIATSWMTPISPEKVINILNKM